MMVFIKMEAEFDRRCGNDRKISDKKGVNVPTFIITCEQDKNAHYYFAVEQDVTAASS